MNDQMQNVPTLCTKAQRWRHFVMSMQDEIRDQREFVGYYTPIAKVLCDALKTQSPDGLGVVLFFDDGSWFVVTKEPKLGGRYVKFKEPPPSSDYDAFPPRQNRRV